MNIFPAIDLIDGQAVRLQKGDYAKAAALGFRVNPFVKKLFCEVNPIPCKKALQLIGIDVGSPRLPLTESEPQHTQALAEEMRKIGLLAN